MAQQLTIPNLSGIGSWLITAAIPLGAYGIVNLFAPANLFLFEPIESVSWFIIAAGAAAAAHRFAPRR